MQYKSTDELNQFSFEEAAIASISYTGNTFILELDNVTILADNRHNRDIHDMRANNVVLTFSDASLTKVIAEGYKVYDADNNLKETVEDTLVPPEDYADFFKEQENNMIYSIENTDGYCTISIDGEYETYLIETTYAHSFVEWDRFLKKE